MKRVALSWITVLLFSMACTKVAPPNEDFLVNRSFAHLFFPTKQECMEAQPEPDFFYNCHQQVDFYDNNVVQLMLTDILWRGTYKIEEDLVILSFEPNFEISDGEVIFRRVEGNKLLRIENQTLWKEVTGGSIWD